MPKDFDPKHTKRKTPYSKPKPKSSQSQEREEKQYPSVNDLKRRIRDVKRLLAKPDLPADKRIIQERALSGYEKELADEEKRRERSRMIKKYHFVRFLGMAFPKFYLFLPSFLPSFLLDCFLCDANSLLQQTAKQPRRKSTNLRGNAMS